MLLVAGCGASAHSAEGQAATGGPCAVASPVVVGDPSLCLKAISLAEARLGWLHWPITSTTFRSNLCPPNARCAFAASQGWVIFTFWTGDPVMVHVAPAGDIALLGEAGVGAAGLIAGDPEPLPDWLLDELGTMPKTAPNAGLG
jgi:hypothetical protein